uniref:MADF domain-containing protein n=1 Tax=Scylla olivacea TaxID=85551 RepID=A0A0P4WL80_SCYOL
MSAEIEHIDIDTEHFILEVEARPALWDVHDENYSNRDAKKKNWEELVTIFLNKEGASAAEQYGFGKHLQRKWKSLRDCYVRERQRLLKIKSGSTASRKTQYVFYNHLSFLHGVIKGKDPSSTTDERHDRPSDGEQTPTSSAPQHAEMGRGKRKRADGIIPEVECLLNVLQDGKQSRDERKESKEEDEDRLFLLSLVTPMKKIPEHLRFGVRMEIMQVIHSAIQNQTPNSINNPNQTVKLQRVSKQSEIVCESNLEPDSERGKNEMKAKVL